MDFKNLFKRFTANEANIMRWFILAATTLSLIWGVLIIYVEPTIIEYFGQRLLIACVWLGIGLASFFSERVRQSIRFLTNANSYIFTLWVAWLMYINQFALVYVYGFMLTFISIASFIVIPHYLRWFLLSINILVAIMCYISPPADIHPFLFVTIFISLSVATYLVFIARLYDSHQLKKLNVQLEEIVAERTAIAESKVTELANSNEALERFAYVASHDLREPLRTISGFADLIKMDLEEGNHEELINYSNYIIDGVTRMDHLTNDLLVYSRLGRKKLDHQLVDLDLLIKEVISSFSDTTNTSKANIEVISPLPTIICSPGQMTQLFTNLIENGIKFNRNSPEIKINVFEKEEEWIFSIKDNGIGIRQKYAGKVFEIFQRLHSKKEYSGTGVGLAICKRVVLNHKGDIWFESEEGNGSTFYFSIPKKSKED